MTITVQELEKILNLEPAHEFIKKRLEHNIKEGLTECAGLRQTGRTTRMMLRAIQYCSEGNDIQIVAYTKHMGKIYMEKLKAILDKVPNLGFKIKDGVIWIGRNSISCTVNKKGTFFDDCINEVW